MERRAELHLCNCYSLQATPYDHNTDTECFSQKGYTHAVHGMLDSCHLEYRKLSGGALASTQYRQRLFSHHFFSCMFGAGMFHDGRSGNTNSLVTLSALAKGEPCDGMAHSSPPRDFVPEVPLVRKYLLILLILRAIRQAGKHILPSFIPPPPLQLSSASSEYRVLTRQKDSSRIAMDEDQPAERSYSDEQGKSNITWVKWRQTIK